MTRKPQTRLELFTLQDKGASVVEVGTRFGDLANAALETRRDLELTVVDSWEGQFKDAEAEARNRLTGKAFIIKERSVPAAEAYGGLADMVYIDAAHDMANVDADVRAWWPKVKSGGILSGHDYETKPDDGYWGPIEVKEAVDAWAKEEGLQVNVIDENPPSWWVVKP